MKRIIMSAMVLAMLLASLGGCFPGWYEDGGGGRGGGHDRGERHDRDQRHEDRR
jgi:hypothetical protein